MLLCTLVQRTKLSFCTNWSKSDDGSGKILVFICHQAAGAPWISFAFMLQGSSWIYSYPSYMIFQVATPSLRFKHLGRIIKQSIPVKPVLATLWWQEFSHHNSQSPSPYLPGQLVLLIQPNLWESSFSWLNA